MSLIQSQIAAALEQGGTLVVPSRQREVALRLAHTRLQLAAGLTAWPSPEICTWSTWLERCAEQARRGSLRGRRRLGRGEEWLLWREAALEACEGLELMSPASLGDALQRSSMLQDAWNVRWTGSAVSEYGVLQRARTAMARRCRARGLYSGSDWAAVLAGAPPAAAPLLFAGFPLIGGALQARLRALGASFAEDAAGLGAAAAGPRQVRSGADRSDELRLAAQWCRERLEQDPAARLLVVIPELLEQRAAAIQAFEHALHGGALLAERGDALYALEGGQPLSRYPLVAAALGLLALASGPIGFSQAAAVLRSPYLGCGSQAQRAALELLLRERNVHRADFALLLALARTGVSGPLAGLAAALEIAASSMLLPWGERHGAGWWARRYVEILEALGWPGTEPLGSPELQQRDRLRELLGEFDRLGEDGEPLRAYEAFELLDGLARRTAFEPESADVPVTLTASLDDPLVSYEGIWVAGLASDTWPAPPRPDPFLPIPAQRELGYPPASPQGQLLAAQRAMAAWERCAAQVIYSWPEFDGEVPLEPSHLLVPAPAPRSGTEERLRTPLCPDRLVQAVQRSARREARPAELPIAWPRARHLPRGTRTVELQSLCPFRALAELRLAADPVVDPVPGLDRRERGQILHHALELVWGQFEGSRALKARSREPKVLHRLVRAAVARALETRLSRRVLPLAAALVENEQRRLEGLILDLLDQDLARADVADFTVSQLEQSREAELGGMPIRVRMDRVDRLEDGRLIILDYKSGRAQPFKPLDERPRQAQLLAYATLAPAPLAGIAAVYLRAGEVLWRGAAADPALLPDLGKTRAATAPWPELLLHWRKVIDTLAGEFAAGVATVQPRPGACRDCHLPGLCRIAAEKQPPPESESEGAPDDAD